jgi:hypothetical protein
MTLLALNEVPRSLLEQRRGQSSQPLTKGAKGMTFIAKSRSARKYDPLPLFVWADRNNVAPIDPLLVTRKLAGRVRVSASVLNVMAEAHGFIGREASPHG